MTELETLADDLDEIRRLGLTTKNVHHLGRAADMLRLLSTRTPAMDKVTKALDELYLLVDEFHPNDGDWGFRKTVITEVIDRARLAAQSAAPVGEPVAYRVKDYADGWILCHTREVAEHEADGQCLIQPLYAASPSGSPVGWGDDYPKDQSDD